MSFAQDLRHLRRQHIQGEDARPERIGEIVVEVGDGVGNPANLPFERQPLHRLFSQEVAARLGVVEYSIAYLPHQVQAAAVFFQLLDDSQALAAVAKSARMQFVHSVLADVSERRVTEVVSECDGFSEVFVQVERARYRPRYLGHLQGVRQTGGVVVAEWGYEDLCLVLQPPERLGVQDAVPVALKLGASGG